MLPKSVRGSLRIRRTCRKKIHERITAVSGNPCFILVYCGFYDMIRGKYVVGFDGYFLNYDGFCHNYTGGLCLLLLVCNFCTSIFSFICEQLSLTL